MKKLLSFALALVLTSSIAFAQNTTTASFEVVENCFVEVTEGDQIDLVIGADFAETVSQTTVLFYQCNTEDPATIMATSTDDLSSDPNILVEMDAFIANDGNWGNFGTRVDAEYAIDGSLSGGVPLVQGIQNGYGTLDIKFSINEDSERKPQLASATTGSATVTYTISAN